MSLAFDGQGDLWVGNGFTTSTIVQFHPSADQRHRQSHPERHLGSSAGSITNPDALAIDDSGNLWVADDMSHRAVWWRSRRTNWRPVDRRCPRSP